MSKATPGPWQLHSHMGEHFVTGGNPSFMVAHVSNGRTHHEPDEANARLIAAAPCLLEALSAFLTHFGMDEDDWTKPTFDQARAAITKVTGSQA